MCYSGLGHTLVSRILIPNKILTISYNLRIVYQDVTSARFGQKWENAETLKTIVLPPERGGGGFLFFMKYDASISCDAIMNFILQLCNYVGYEDHHLNIYFKHCNIILNFLKIYQLKICNKYPLNLLLGTQSRSPSVQQTHPSLSY